MDIRKVFLWFSVALTAWAGPVDFGKAQFDRALQERGLGRMRVQMEVTTDPPESYRILPGRITGGDLRGLMYGLLEAADQIREHGRLLAIRGAPAMPIRGVRYFLHNKDLEEDWYYSHDYWKEYFAMLARNRFNRFNLVFAHQTDYLAPPYPYWLALPEFPKIRVPGLSAERRERNFEMLKYISQTAADYGIDFTLGVWEQNVQANMKPTVVGLTRENLGPYTYAALKKILAECPAIRSVQMRTNRESGIPNDQQVSFYQRWVFRAISEAGRRVVLDMRGWSMQPGMLEAATTSGAPLRLSAKYWAEHIGRPYQPAETWRNYSYIDFLKKPRPYGFYWEVWGLGSNRLLLWGNPDFVRRMAPTFTLSGTLGFEIDPPLAQKGFGNRSGKWGIFTPGQEDRVFWKWEFERYWLFYLLWGRISYDPKTPASVWMAELKRRFGTAAQDVLEAYKQSGNILPEIVAAHMGDPNMYIWPEINPGGLTDEYRYIRPSDWRFIASIPEAVHNQVNGEGSAKQTPEQTAERLEKWAAGTEEAVTRVRDKLGPTHKGWRGSEPDFLVLAALARYHARKQLAAEQLTRFYETGDPAGLGAATRESKAALHTWEKLVELTDGLYPVQMAFGPAEVGHWKDKLPYVRHDLKLLSEREKIFHKFGRFDFGFDLGGPIAELQGASYRRDPYILRNTVEPRFQVVDPGTRYSEKTGYGWVTDGLREANSIPLTPYEELRGITKDPKHLPQNTLFGDSIHGQGAQTFRVRTGDGRFRVYFLHPDDTFATAHLRSINGVVDVRFPSSDWTVSGLVLEKMGSEPQKPSAASSSSKPSVKPAVYHTPTRKIAPGRPLTIALKLSSTASVKSVRLYYRPLNQLAKFKMLEASPARPIFTIPAQNISTRWDLMYYFEILSRQGTGWFHPDPWVTTPYYVVNVE
jgi:hypothetical protein